MVFKKLRKSLNKKKGAKVEEAKKKVGAKVTKEVKKVIDPEEAVKAVDPHMEVPTTVKEAKEAIVDKLAPLKEDNDTEEGSDASPAPEDDEPATPAAEEAVSDKPEEIQVEETRAISDTSGWNCCGLTIGA